MYKFVSMKYLPTLCQLGNCTELVVTNSCNNCCTELTKTPVQIDIAVTFDDITVNETKIIESEADLQGTLASFVLEDFIYFAVCYDTSKPVKNMVYTITVNGVNYSYTNVGGTWDTVFNALDIYLSSTGGFDTVYENNCIKISGTGITDTATVTVNTTDLTVTGPVNSGSGRFPNKVYTITSVITFDDNTTDTMITYTPFTCQLDGCIFTELSKVASLVDCGCNSECIQTIMNNYLILMNITGYSINNQVDIDTVNEQIAILEAYCLNKNCNCNG